MNSVAVLIPCFNEEKTVGKVIDDFREFLPDAKVYVFDNNSTDSTKCIAEKHGAIVKRQPIQGKGITVSRMFLEIDADIYVLVDGDDTYPAEVVNDLIAPVKAGDADMVCGDRLSNGSYRQENKRSFHDFGNNLVCTTINKLFRSQLKDIMTGYRVFNKMFVKNIPILSNGFEIETEMTLHALDLGYKIKEIPIVYKDRPAGSSSKLNTFSDGLKVISKIFSVYKDYKPLKFFGFCALLSGILGLFAGTPPLIDFVIYKHIYHIPLALLATGLELFMLNLFTCGLILDTIAKNHKREYKLNLLAYCSTEK